MQSDFKNNIHWVVFTLFIVVQTPAQLDNIFNVKVKKLKKINKNNRITNFD